VTEKPQSAEPEAGEEAYYYLTIDDILGLYAELFDCTVTEAADQIRSRDGIEGALARPRSYALYERADLSVQAASLAHGIAEGQYFVEGNKRIALVALMTFLHTNGYDVSASQHERAMWILDFSAGLTVYELADKIRPCLVARDPNVVDET
jgi:death-on-curing protein